MLERYARLLRGEPDTQRMDLRVVRPDGVILWVRIVTRLVRTPRGWRIRERYEERAYTYNVPPGLLPVVD